MKTIYGAMLTSLCAAIACSDVEWTFRSIEAVCIEDLEQAEGPWICPESVTIECGDPSAPSELYVPLDEGACAGVDLEVDPGPYPPGVHQVDVVDQHTGDVVCVGELIVVDETPPEVETIDRSLWPPNHKFHAVSTEDCLEVVDACDPDWTSRFTYVASDEPENAQGDGNSSPDIQVISATEVELRSERQGGSNGRVYTLGWVVEDSSGNTTEGTCRVAVDHDRSGSEAIDDGEAYRVDIE